VYSGSSGGTVLVWDLEAKKGKFGCNFIEAKKLSGHRAACVCVEPEHDENSHVIITGS
jgi:hypothetical protein